jgi:hypothetical protein
MLHWLHFVESNELGLARKAEVHEVEGRGQTLLLRTPRLHVNTAMDERVPVMLMAMVMDCLSLSSSSRCIGVVLIIRMFVGDPTAWSTGCSRTLSDGPKSAVYVMLKCNRFFFLSFHFLVLSFLFV